jgi:hypothetical protein
MGGYERLLLAVITSLATGAAIAACGGSTGGQAPKANPTYADAAAVNDAFSKSGHPCTGYAPQTPSGLGSNFVDTEASCTLQGVHLTIDTFKDSGAETNWLGSLKTSACASASGLGPPGYAFVEGDRWVITGTISVVANAIARSQVGGTAKVAPCGGSATGSSTTSQPQIPSP